ncbi:CBASS oligonucleotide cyclase [Peteryoungia ipomoeae]|uniref:Nucleotidyltransferase n=1 Tax=Peteryoungia ipomoeae TaxID=1210932 RepID=A0A4S8P6W7_9HYPH|nr:CBASS oligonucleotide cyclase [Peteryoungia ipomoeae]THV25085.1 nucleotidyltransferase [Peteryoungia ipomoeae]
MGGGGGGGPFINRSAEQFAKLVKKTEDETAVKAFEADLGGMLNELLAEANGRDVELVKARLDEIKECLSSDLEVTIDSLFGGSVARHTYVDGLSDIDSLLVLNGSPLEAVSPASALARIETAVRQEVDDAVSVSKGKLAVTVTYSDGMEIQLLPAFRTESGLKVPSFRHGGWSSIAPEGFQKALSATNAHCGGKLVPMIKLAKAVMGTLPEGQRLTGYHVESLAIAAFKNYGGPKNLASMLPAFFDKAKDLIHSPIKDSSGQSVHVDGYLGGAGSPERLATGHVLGRIAKRMRNASAHCSHQQWQALLGIDND